jgi:hydrogenase maturation protease
MNTEQITILGVGNYLFTDEGVGIRVIEKLEQEYDFPDNVIPVDGGVLGVHLMGVISAADHLIVVDAIRNDGAPGSLYRMAGEEIPLRILAKNSLHQVDLLEALTLVNAIDRSPETVIVGVEPEDIETMGVELTPTIAAKVDDLIEMVLKELDRLKATYVRRNQIN